jgi:hypothetical protein
MIHKRHLDSLFRPVHGIAAPESAGAAKMKVRIRQTAVNRFGRRVAAVHDLSMRRTFIVFPLRGSTRFGSNSACKEFYPFRPGLIRWAVFLASGDIRKICEDQAAAPSVAAPLRFSFAGSRRCDCSHFSTSAWS